MSVERIPFDVNAEFRRILLATGFSADRADRCARLFTENSRDGVMSHGLNRFPAFVDSCRDGTVDVHAEPSQVQRLGVIEQWDGKCGVGLLNAEFAMARAIAIAGEHAMGCVGLKNSNHWMRAGAYGLQAADAGCIGLCWTNTTALMPAWGAAARTVGNNPLTLCVPHQGNHVLLDMAMSQFSNGKLEVLRRRGEMLPVPGGFDASGNPTTDPAAILDGGQPLAIGNWKGSGLALVLDLLATIISGGDSTGVIASRDCETKVSQVFIAIDAESLTGARLLEETVARVVAEFKSAPAIEGGDSVRYPGEGMMAARRDSLERGIAVDAALWAQVLQM